jgi:4-methyl-5(b-hydroxyethyl)-thiazole monophosphate biosynthesis
MSTALVIIVDGVEELEATAPIDLLRRAGVGVTVASAGESKTVSGRNGIQLGADVLLHELAADVYDLVVVPGGPGHVTLLENADLLGRLSAQNARNGWIGSICAGPLVLKKAGVLDGRRFTSFPGTSAQLPDRDPVSPVVVDGNLVTSQGAGTAILFGLALVQALCGEAVRREIAESICLPADASV